MPRNDQITRQWHLPRHLQSSKGATLEELVHTIPDDYPKNSRTIRRDLEALEAVGFPLVTERVNGQTRWLLIESFRNIPALGFSASELMALVFSRKPSPTFRGNGNPIAAQFRTEQSSECFASARA